MSLQYILRRLVQRYTGFDIHKYSPASGPASDWIIGLTSRIFSAEQVTYWL